MQDWFVVLMGSGAVFVVLTLIIGLCYLLALICKETKEAEAPAQVSDAAIPNRGELAAAIGAAIAEYTGTDLSAIRILSIKKI